MPGNRHVPFLGEGTAVTLFPLTRLAGQRARSHHTHLPFQGPVGHSLAKHGGVLVGRPGSDPRTCECAGFPAPLRYSWSWSVSARSLVCSAQEPLILPGSSETCCFQQEPLAIHPRESQLRMIIVPALITPSSISCSASVSVSSEINDPSARQIPVTLLRKMSFSALSAPARCAATRSALIFKQDPLSDWPNGAIIGI